MTVMCAFFGVSRSGYYDFVQRMDKPDRDKALAIMIAECQKQCRKTYGYRRVHIGLERMHGLRVNPKTVLRVVGKYGLLSEIRRRRKYRHTIREAKAKEMVTTELQLHSDQGFQYTSHAYFNLSKEYGITPSMSRRGNCLDNAMAENFFSILKSECINRQKIKDFSTANTLIDDYIHFYNHERIST